MRKIYKRKAWLIDDEIILSGYTSKRKFFPNNLNCGFSSQKFKRKDINKIIFFNENTIENINLETL